MEENSKDILGLKKFGEATKTLAEIFKDACGIVIDPAKQITIGAAERYNERRAALQKYQIERMELTERAKTRLLETEIRRQENLELIASRATKLLPENASPENLNIDWLHIALDYCKDISEEELQDIWAKILSCEAENSGSVSRKTLDTVKNFSKADCDLFYQIAPYFIPIENEGKGYAIIIENIISIQYDNILKLGYLGILNSTNISFSIHFLVQTSFNNKKININYKNSTPLKLSIYNVSTIGFELMRALKIEQNEKYFNEFIELTKKGGATVEYLK
ncbi:MAG: DUF2806 domain-containing protein [Saprospiraceae bacterium]|nr:DUF2806 domain-containing protein [Saprospiraceae bacterium]